MSRQSSPAPLPVLITRPAAQAARFAAELSEAFGDRLRPLLSPLMAAEYLPFDLPPTRHAALILTSETGAEAAGDRRGALPDLAFCVGDRTADAARRAGFTALSAAGAAQDLVDLILSSPVKGPFLYLHGQDRAADIGRILGERGLTVDSRAAYVQRPLPLGQEAEALLASEADILLPLFSPRSVRLFFQTLRQKPVARLWPVVISENAFAQLPVEWAEGAEIAPRPDGAGMLAAIARQLERASS